MTEQEQDLINSLAFTLPKSDTGQTTLIQSHLARKIRSDVLNTIEKNTGQSIAFHLARTNRGL